MMNALFRGVFVHRYRWVNGLFSLKQLVLGYRVDRSNKAPSLTQNYLFSLRTNTAREKTNKYFRLIMFSLSPSTKDLISSSGRENKGIGLC